jgi:hypothetical protein
MRSERLLWAVAGALGLAFAIAACSDSPAAPASTAKSGVCNYLVSPASVTTGITGGSVSVTAVGDSACPWTASTTDAWIHFSGANTGQGTGFFKFTADLQSPEPRHGTVTVIWNAGGTSIGVDQGCWSNKVTQTVNVTPELQSSLVDVGVACSLLLAPHPTQFDVPWLFFVSTHVGGSQLEFGVDNNTGPERAGHVITDVGTITVVQGAGNCVTAISPTSQAFDAKGGSGSITVTGVPGCAWDAIVHDDYNRAITPNIVHGSGNGLVTFTLAANPYPAAIRPYFIVGGTLRFQITQSEPK